MRTLAICTLLLLTACSSPGLINYNDQPGLYDTPPTTAAPPVGKWTRTPTICVDDSVVYLSEGGFADDSLAQMVQGIADPVAREFVQYVHGIEPNINARFIDNIEYADIPVRLYAGRSSKPSSKPSSDMSELEKWLILIGVTAIVANADIHGSTVGFDLTGASPDTERLVMNMLNRQPPPVGTGWNGVCYYTRRGEKLTATSVWIECQGLPDRHFAEVYLQHVIRHELGHAVIGLNDNLPDSWNPPDDTPDGPGLMSYTGGWMGGYRAGVNYPAGWFSFDEVDTIWWLYGGK